MLELEKTLLKETEQLVNMHYEDDSVKTIILRNLRDIRKHVSGKDTGVPTNDGWIPVEERLPAEGEEVLITTDVGLIATGYIHCCEWITDQEPDYPIAWRPLPEPYRPERSDNHDRE